LVSQLATVDEAGRIRVGLIGAGSIARAHAHALLTLNHIGHLPARVEIVTVCSSSVERSRGFTEEFGVPRWTTEWREVVADETLDAVAVLTPDSMHSAPSIAAASAGKHVLCEKPLARSAAEAWEMVEAARASGVVASCGFNYRFVPAIQLLRSIIEEGRLGQIRMFRGSYLQDWAASPDLEFSWRFDRMAGGGAISDYVHIVDLLRFLTGDPVDVSSSVVNCIGERSAGGRSLAVTNEDGYAAVLDMGWGVALLMASRCAVGCKGRQQIEVFGEKGTCSWDMEDLNRLSVCFMDEEPLAAGFRSIHVTDPRFDLLGEWWGAGHSLGWEHALVHMWRAFLEQVLDPSVASPSLATFEDGWRAATITDAIKESARDRRPVSVQTPTAAGGIAV
jgi:predicted dehydrogenase